MAQKSPSQPERRGTENAAPHRARRRHPHQPTHTHLPRHPTPYGRYPGGYGTQGVGYLGRWAPQGVGTQEMGTGPCTARAAFLIAKMRGEPRRAAGKPPKPPETRLPGRKSTERPRKAPKDPESTERPRKAPKTPEKHRKTQKITKRPRKSRNWSAHRSNLPPPVVPSVSVLS